MRRLPAVLALAMLVFGLASAPRLLVSNISGTSDFVHFESGHVRPAVLTPGGGRLLVVNTSDNRLAVFDLTGPLPAKVADVAVGLEPISVAALSDNEAWVVNQLSDDVSIVDLTTMHVRATLRVGDEPSDVVFAGAPLRAYVSVSQEDAIKVYDPATLEPVVAPIAVQGRMPRALARNADGSRVFAAVFHAGNRTSVLSAEEALDSLPPPDPPMSGGLPPAPDVGLIVQKQGNDWRDESGKLWNAKIKYDVLDTDLIEIRTSDQTIVRTFGGIGTNNFGLAVNAAGTIAVTATEARNLLRFEPNLRGHNVDTRAGLVSAAGALTLRDLNPHVNYDVSPGPPSERDSALGIPTGVAWSGDGLRLYVTSLASDRLGVLDPAAPTPAAALLTRRPTVAGPTGVVVDDARGRLYVVGRFRNQLETLSSATFASLAVARIGFDPTPDAIVNGRKFFYGGSTSGHGEHACASCHVFGDFDNIAWDLGDPTGTYQAAPPGQIDPALEGFHPMKGPMVTQSLRGLPGTGLLHWRGDRANLAAFNPAFVGLLGRATPLPDSEMVAFGDFVLPLRYPPNPHQLLDRSMPDAPVGQPSALRGQAFYFNTPVDAILRCNDCHAANGFGPGTNGQIINDASLGEDQDIKIPQLRNMYKKTGFTDAAGAINKRGFGFIHDGSVDNLFDFLLFPGFNFGTNANAKRVDLEAFLLAFDTGTAPAVGHSITFHGPNNGDVALIARMTTLQNQTTANACDLIARGRVGGVPRGWLYQDGLWLPDVAGEPGITSAALRALGGPGSEVTAMGVPTGSGLRMGRDRDRDTHFDGDELAAGSDPGDPASTPANVGVPPGGRFTFQGVRPNPFRASAEIHFTLGVAGPVDCAVYDVLGREVASLARARRFEAGPQRLTWSGRTDRGADAAAGVYFVRVRTDAGASVKTLVRVR